MSEPLDVALRIRLAYEAGGAKTAIHDIEALRTAVGTLGTGAMPGHLARNTRSMPALMVPITWI